MVSFPQFGRLNLNPANACEKLSKRARGMNALASAIEEWHHLSDWLRFLCRIVAITIMAISVIMPALEMAQETGKVIAWLKKEGESVAKGEPLLEIQTDKAVMEIESPGDGVLAGITVQAGAEVPVGRNIAWIVRPGEAPPVHDVVAESGRKAPTAVSAASAVPTSAPADQPPTSTKQGTQFANQAAKISPKARRMASERG